MIHRSILNKETEPGGEACKRNVASYITSDNNEHSANLQSFSVKTFPLVKVHFSTTVIYYLTD